jgi:hypothetical protein
MYQNNFTNELIKALEYQYYSKRYIASKKVDKYDNKGIKIIKES